MKSIDIPDGVISIEGSTFARCNRLENVSIPNSVTAIYTSAFFACHSLEIIDIPNSVKIIGIEAFGHCTKIKSVTIPENVTHVLQVAFSGCTALEVVNIEAIQPPLGGELIFEDCSSLTAIKVPNESVNAYRTADGWRDYADIIVGYDF